MVVPGERGSRLPLGGQPPPYPIERALDPARLAALGEVLTLTSEREKE